MHVVYVCVVGVPMCMWLCIPTCIVKSVEARVGVFLSFCFCDQKKLEKIKGVFRLNLDIQFTTEGSWSKNYIRNQSGIHGELVLTRILSGS